MRRFVYTLSLLYVATLSFAQHLPAEKIMLPGSGLDNLYQIDEGVYRSEQPGRKDFEALEAFGIRETLNLRRFHSDDDEAKGTAIRLHRVRTHAHTICERQVVEALRIIRDRRGPILVHCLHGSDRTGAVVAMYRIVFQDYTKDEAIEEMTAGGFGFHRIYGNIVRMVKNADVERIKKEVFGP